MAKIASNKFNVLYELEQISWKFDPVSSSEIKCICPDPKHKDNNPSATVNINTGAWKCFACPAKGDLITFLAYAKSQSRDSIFRELSSRYDLSSERSIPGELVEKMHQQIKKAGPLLQALYDRGVTDDMIRQARLGYHEGRITIPVTDSSGNVINIRKYLPGAPTEKKMLNTKGYGKVRIYQISSLMQHNKVWICGGEMKALVVKSMLEPFNIGACSATAGEGNWDSNWNTLFKDKEVWICMDIDVAGVTASKKIAENVAPFAAKVKIVSLPLDKEKYPKGDINDLVGKEKATAENLMQIMASAPDYVPGVSSFSDTERGNRSVNLVGITNPDNIGYRLEFEACVTATDPTPFLVPKTVNVSCTRDQPQCATCPVLQQEADSDGFVKMMIGPTSSGIMGLVGVDKRSQVHATREALKIPLCKKVEFYTTSHYSVVDARLSPQLHASSSGGGDVLQPAYIVDMDPDMQTPYIMRGRLYPSPRTQQAVLVIDDLTETSDSLESFAPEETELGALDIFRPNKNQSVRQKLEEIYEDLSANVTHIHQRFELHLAVDLCYHSVLEIDIGHKKMPGWMQVLILGDSSQGKTETAMQLRGHYDLGEKIECKGATISGLLGGMEQLSGKWFVKWGGIPTNDRRLVILEELKGASTEVIGKLTDMRSSGIAETNKIERRKAFARTRLLALSNPRGIRPLASYSFGVEAIHELIGSLEDVRRFDFCIVVAAGQVNTDAMRKKEVDHRYTSELCRRLILWLWTRNPSQVHFTPAAKELIQKMAKELTDEYTESIPLLDRGTTSQKLMRMSAAIAGRVFSRQGDNLVIGVDHVKCAVEFLRQTYSSPAFGYLEYSRSQNQLNRLLDSDAVEKFLLTTVKYPKTLIQGFLRQDQITLADLQDWTETTRDTAQIILSYFVRMHALKRIGRQEYGKTSEFISLLKKLESSASDVKTSFQDDM